MWDSNSKNLLDKNKDTEEPKQTKATPQQPITSIYKRIIPEPTDPYHTTKNTQNNYKITAIKFEELSTPCWAKASVKPFIERPTCWKQTSIEEDKEKISLN